MTQLFSDIPEAIYNIHEVIEKIEPFALARDVLLPKFDIPSNLLFLRIKRMVVKEGRMPI